jgi:hypothetical protein
MKKIVVVLVLLMAVFMCFSSARAVTQTEIDTAIARGLRWLADQPQPSYFPVALVAFAVLKFEDHAAGLKKNPFDPDYMYHQEVEDGWNYLSTRLFTDSLTYQSGNNPEQYTDNDSLGIRFDSFWGTHSSYETGIVMMALQASASPDRVFPNHPSCATTFKDVLEDCVDWCAWAQCDSGDGRGGWRYTAYNNQSGDSDNSVSQWPVLGLLAGKAWGINAPDFVKTELQTYWLPFSQYIHPGDPSNHGGFGYGDSLDPNVARTASGMVQLRYCDADTTNFRWDAARNWIGNNWSSDNIGNLYAMYAVMKAAMTAKPRPIWWFGDHEWQPEYDDTLLAVQDTNPASPYYGSWPLEWGYFQIMLSTEWALLILQKVVPPSAIPTLTEWGLIIFGVVLLGFITYVFLRRRKAVVSLR